MKRNLLILALILLGVINADALIVSVQTHGEIGAEGMALTITEGEPDLLTGATVMGLDGNVLSEGKLTVTITRSEEGLTDEFCCAGHCISGNGAREEQLGFEDPGMATWFIHYQPAAGSDVTMSYTFEDESGEKAELTVRYVYEAQGIEEVESKQKAEKILKEGILYIIKNDVIYNL